jgi:acyl-CoA synthetase (NDP forming)
MRVDSLAEMFDVARVLLHQPVPRGDRVAIVSNSLGATSLTLDACAAADLRVDSAVSLAFDAGPDDYGEAVASLAASGSVDALVIIYAPAMRDERAEVARVLGLVAPPDITTVATFLRSATAHLPVSGDRSIPLFEFPDEAVRALGVLANHRRWLDRESGELVPDLEPGVAARISAVASAALAESPQGRWLGWTELQQVADAAGLPLAEGQLVDNAADAARAAEHLGPPVVLKAQGVVRHHRAETGGVALDLRSDVEAAEAYERLEVAVGNAMHPALVQRMVEPGVDVLVAAHRHPNVGVVVQVGLGGIASLGDHGKPVGLVPLTDSDAWRLIRHSSVEPVLAAADPTGVSALHVHQLVMGLAAVVDAIPELADVVANPVIVNAHGAHVADLRVRVLPCEEAPPDVRRL